VEKARKTVQDFKDNFKYRPKCYETASCRFGEYHVKRFHPH